MLSQRTLEGSISLTRIAENSKDANSIEITVRVTGTSPLSFDVRVGATLQVKEFSPSAPSRPSVGGGFKTRAFLLFNDRTKVGRLSTASLLKLGEVVPNTCTVLEVNRQKRLLFVSFSFHSKDRQ